MSEQENRVLRAIVWDSQHNWNERAVDWNVGPLKKVYIAELTPKDGDHWRYAREVGKNFGVTVLWAWTGK